MVVAVTLRNCTFLRVVSPSVRAEGTGRRRQLPGGDHAARLRHPRQRAVCGPVHLQRRRRRRRHGF